MLPITFLEGGGNVAIRVARREFVEADVVRLADPRVGAIFDLTEQQIRLRHVIDEDEAVRREMASEIRHRQCSDSGFFIARSAIFSPVCGFQRELCKESVSTMSTRPSGVSGICGSSSRVSGRCPRIR